MFGHYFSHNLLRKYILLFGNFFNDLKLTRTDEDGNPVQTLTIPVDYSSKQKTMALRERAKFPGATEDDPKAKTVAIQLPRIGFEVTSITYDSNRQLQSTQQNRSFTSDPNRLATQFVQVPFNIDFSLYIMAKNQDDAFKIVEQILPFFTPDLSASVRLVPEMNTTFDINLTLTSQSVDDDSTSSDASERRVLIWTLTFTMNAWLFGPVTKQGPIKKVVVDFYAAPGSGPVTGNDINTTPRTQRTTVLPGLTEDGKPTSRLEESVPYLQINADDDYGFITINEEFQDGKRRDPFTGTDKPIR